MRLHKLARINSGSELSRAALAVLKPQQRDGVPVPTPDPIAPQRDAASAPCVISSSSGHYDERGDAARRRSKGAQNPQQNAASQKKRLDARPRDEGDQR